MSSFIGIGFDNIAKRDLKKVIRELPIFFDNAAYYCMNTGERCAIYLDFENYVITASNKKYRRIYKLPKTLTYFKKNSDGTMSKRYSFDITSTGNSNQMFLIFVCDRKEEEVLHRMGIYPISVLKYIKIRSFMPKKEPILTSDDKYYEIEKWKEMK